MTLETLSTEKGFGLKVFPNILPLKIYFIVYTFPEILSYKMYLNTFPIPPDQTVECQVRRFL